MTGNVCACSRPCADAYLCRDCTTQLHGDLGTLAALLPELDAALTRQVGRGWGAGARSAERPLPYDTRVTPVHHATLNHLAYWLGRVAEAQGMVQPGPWNAAQAALDLQGLLGKARLLPDAQRLADDTHRHAKEVTRIVDLAPEQWYAGVCAADTDRGECGEHLYATAGSSTVKCRCGAEHDVEERRRWLAEAVQDHLGTAVEISRLCAVQFGEKVSTSAIRGYVHRGRVSVHGSRQGAALYRVGDVLEAARLATVSADEWRATKRAGRAAV